MTEDLSSTIHRLFIVLYALAIAMSIFVSVSSAIVTDYWREDIGGCILYANLQAPKRNSNGSEWTMHGSDISVCNYVTFVPVFLIFIALVCIVFHLRSLFCQRCWRAEEGKSDFWDIILRVIIALSGIMTFLALVLACIVTHGNGFNLIIHLFFFSFFHSFFIYHNIYLSHLSSSCNVVFQVELELLEIIF